MKLRKLKKIIDDAVLRSGETDPDVEVWFKKKMYEIRSIGQFNVIPDLTIEIGEKLLDLGN